MTIATDIHTDLLTPRGVPATARRGLGWRVPARVGRGGRSAATAWSARSRLVSFAEAETAVAAGRRSSATSATTTSPSSSRRCRCRRTGPASRRAASSLRTRSSASTTSRTSPRSSPASGIPSSACSVRTWPGVRPQHRSGMAREARDGSRRRATTRRACAGRRSTSARATRTRSSCRSAPSADRRSALELYRALRRVNPSPYHFLLELGDLALVGSSPETLVKLEGTRASVNPIAGTIEPGDGDAARLLASEKDRAEHVMLVDLGRNDLSRVPRRHRARRALSRAGALLARRTSSPRSRVSSSPTSPPSTCCVPALPGPSPALPRCAMQFISELEGYRRPYAGAVGYALPNGSLDTCIAIRTIVLADGVAHLQAGAGIVSDSDPAAEHEECLQSSPRSKRPSSSRSRTERSMILIVDNYDSFTYNLAHLFQELGAEVTVLRNDEIDADGAERLSPSHLVVSPAPAALAMPERASRSSSVSVAASRPGRLPRAPGDRRGVRRRSAPRSVSCTGRASR